jgi:hypothetical protein
MLKLLSVIIIIYLLPTAIFAARLAPSDIPVRETPPSQPLDQGIEPNFSGNINQVNNPEVLEDRSQRAETVSQPEPEEIVPVIEQPAGQSGSGSGFAWLWILLPGLVVVALGYGFLRKSSRDSTM